MTDNFTAYAAQTERLRMLLDSQEQDYYDEDTPDEEYIAYLYNEEDKAIARRWAAYNERFGNKP